MMQVKAEMGMGAQAEGLSADIPAPHHPSAAGADVIVALTVRPAS